MELKWQFSIYHFTVLFFRSLFRLFRAFFVQIASRYSKRYEALKACILARLLANVVS